MGTLFYGPQESPIPVPDRELAHLKMVIIAKLRRNEAFMYSWQEGVANGGGRQSVWFHPTIPIRFRFDGSRQPALNREWLDSLMDAANSTSGLHLIPEPEATASPSAAVG